jgi:hypothetical protein
MIELQNNPVGHTHQALFRFVIQGYFWGLRPLVAKNPVGHPWADRTVYAIPKLFLIIVFLFGPDCFSLWRFTL